MLHYTRTEKIKQMYKEIDVNEMESLVGAKFVKLFTDIDLNDDEVISIFVFDKSIVISVAGVKYTVLFANFALNLTIIQGVVCQTVPFFLSYF